MIKFINVASTVSNIVDVRTLGSFEGLTQGTYLSLKTDKKNIACIYNIVCLDILRLGPIESLKQKHTLSHAFIPINRSWHILKTRSHGRKYATLPKSKCYLALFKDIQGFSHAFTLRSLK
jgi:hypothetical protein